MTKKEAKTITKGDTIYYNGKPEIVLNVGMGWKHITIGTFNRIKITNPDYYYFITKNNKNGYKHNEVSLTPNNEYYEIHFELPHMSDVQIVSTYNGKEIRTMQTAKRCLNRIKINYPQATMFEIALYDETGRID